LFGKKTHYIFGLGTFYHQYFLVDNYEINKNLNEFILARTLLNEQAEVSIKMNCSRHNCFSN